MRRKQEAQINKTAQIKRAAGQLEHDGRAAVLGWMGSPAVRESVSDYKPWAEVIVSPLNRLLTDQVNVCLFLSRCLDVTARALDGEEWINPFATASDGRWKWTTEEREAAPLVAKALESLLKDYSRWLHDKKKVPIDYESAANLFALGQVLLLDVDWTKSPAELVKDIEVMPPVMFDRDGVTWYTSRHASEEAERATGIIRRVYADGLGKTRIPLPYAGGMTRRRPVQTRQLIRLLKQIRKSQPDITIDRLLDNWTNEVTKHPDYKLPEKWQHEPPDRTTLARHWPDLASPKRTS